MGKRITKEEFIERSKQKHGNKYDYSLVEYVNSNIKIDIKCIKHDYIFKQLPFNHLTGVGCPICGGNIRSNTTDFIKKSKIIHGDKYDYSLVNYVNNKTKVDIKCVVHGIFGQRPNDHLGGQGCPICANNVKSNTVEFIKKSKIIHGDKYDYILVDYKSAHKKISIKCIKHDHIFEQTPHRHLIGGDGCPICGGSIKSNIKEFIEKSKKVHGDVYDYSLVDYKNNRTKVKIICPKHGLFTQTPNKHLLKRGCPVCRESRGEKQVRVFLEENNIKYERQKKFDDCRNKLPLPFDFYIESLNLCIEFDGRQHFESFEKWGGEEKLKKTQFNDEIKNRFCKDNNIGLLRIRYDEDIQNKLVNLYNCS